MTPTRLSITISLSPNFNIYKFWTSPSPFLPPLGPMDALKEAPEAFPGKGSTPFLSTTAPSSRPAEVRGHQHSPSSSPTSSVLLPTLQTFSFRAPLPSGDLKGPLKPPAPSDSWLTSPLLPTRPPYPNILLKACARVNFTFNPLNFPSQCTPISILKETFL